MNSSKEQAFRKVIREEIRQLNEVDQDAILSAQDKVNYDDIENKIAGVTGLDISVYKPDGDTEIEISTDGIPQYMHIDKLWSAGKDSSKVISAAEEIIAAGSQYFGGNSSFDEFEQTVRSVGGVIFPERSRGIYTDDIMTEEKAAAVTIAMAAINMRLHQIAS